MKTTSVLLTLCLFTSSSSIAQRTFSEQREYYMLKSKQQKNTSLILGISGSAIFGAGMLIYLSENNNSNNNPNYSKQSSTSGQAIMYAGGGLMLAAIPFQVASNNSRKRAMTIGVSDMRTPMLQQHNIATTFTPSLSIKIGL